MILPNVHRQRRLTVISGRVGAAYFNPVDCVLYLLEDTQESHHYDLTIMRTFLFYSCPYMRSFHPSPRTSLPGYCTDKLQVR
jgi:hypothetical protein